MCDSIANGGYRPPSTAGGCCPPANVIIASNVLSTDGNVIAGNIIAVDGTFTGNLYVAGNIVSNIVYSSLNVSGPINGTSIWGTTFFGDGNGLSNLNASNLTGTISNTNLPPSGVTAGTYGSSANVSQVTVDQYGLVTAASNIGILSSQWTTVAGNVAYQNGVSIGTLSAPPVGSNLYVLGSANITDVLNVSTLYVNSATVFGSATLNVFGISNLNSVLASLYIGNGSGLSNLNSSNLVGNVEAANVASSVTAPAQPNITSVGILTGLNVSGISNLNSIVTSLFIGNGSAISNLNSSNLVGNVANANVALVVSQPTQPNITSVGTLTGLRVNGLLIASNGSGISNLNSSNLVGNVAAANVASSVTNPAQTNITSVGTLTGLRVNGLLIASNGSGISNLNSSNLVGNVANANVALVVSQPAQPNITSVGTLTGLTVNGLLIASNGSAISNINGSNVVGTVGTAQSITNPAQPNITSVGTLTSLTVIGTVTGGTFTGDGEGLVGIHASAILETVATANSVVQPSQPNITSVGTLTGLTVNGLLIASNGSAISNINGSNVSTVGTAKSVTVAAQLNITSVGTLTSLNVSGISNINSIVTNFISGNASGLSNVTAANLTGTISVGNLPTSGVTAGLYGSGANVSSVTVDQYGRVTNASNVAITASQWTSNTGNSIYYANFVGIGSTFVPTANLHVIGNAYVSNSVTTTNIFFTNTIQNTNLPTTAVTPGGYGSVANIPQIVVDQYGRLTSASNIAFLATSQWTSIDANVAFGNGVSIGTLTNPPVGSNLYVLGVANIGTINTSSLSIATINLASANIATLVVPTQFNVVSANVLTGNISTANIVNLRVSTMANLVSANVTTANIATGNVRTLSVVTQANLVSANVTTANITTANVVSANIITLNASSIFTTNSNTTTINASSIFVTNSNLVNANVTTGNILTLNASSIFGTNSNLINANVTTGNILTLNASSIFGTNSNLINANVTTGNIVTLNASSIFGTNSNLVNANVTTGNIVTLNASSIFGTNSNLVNANVTTGNILTLNASSIFGTNSNLVNANVTTGNIATLNASSIFGTNSNLVNANVTTGNIATLNASSIFGTNSNLVNANVTTGNIVTLNASSIFGTNSNLVNANVTTGNIATVNASSIFGINVVTNELTVPGSMYANLTNTTFLFNTLTIPFVNSTTLNVSSTSNLDTLTLVGEPGLTTLYAVGNIFSTNSFSTTNVFATTVNVGTLNAWTISNLATLVVSNNIFASNSLTTGNVFVSNGLAVGPGTLGTNVVIFSNISGGANAFVMDSNGRVTIGSTYRGGSLLSFGQTIANKTLSLYDGNNGDNPATATNFYGFGINGGVLRYQVSDNATNRHVFYGGSQEYARITSTGVSILTGASPAANLHVAGNIYASNSLSTTNVLSSNLNVTYTANIANLVVTSNILPGPAGNTYLTGNLVVSGNVFTSLGSPLGAGGGYYFSLPADIALQVPYTGAVYGTTYPLSVGLSNGFTINGTSTLITVTPNGNFKFSVAGPYLLHAIFNSTDNIRGLAVGSNVADVHGTDQGYMYRYTTFITQNPTELIEIPFNVTDISKYYYLDLFSTDGGSLYQTSNTSGGTYMTITPLQGGGLASGGPGGTPGTQWISSGSNIYYSNSVGIGAVNPQYKLDVSGDLRVTGNIYGNVIGTTLFSVVTGLTSNYTALISDYYIGVNGARKVTLPLGSSISVGKSYIVKDEAGNAAVTSVLLQASGADVIDGNSNVTMSLNNISLTTLWTGTRWSLI